MKIQILVATMNRTDHALLEELNLQSDAVVVNQCGREGSSRFQFNGHEVLWIDSAERGLSRSRNMALGNADGDVCVLCDDDERLSDGYPEMIAGAYGNLPDADFVAFNARRIGWHETEALFTEPKPLGRFRTCSSVHITFRRDRIQEKGICFDTRFGAGSGMYSCAEDAIFCMNCHSAGLAMYTYPGILCDVRCEESTWFCGYNEKYFFDVGAYLSNVYPRLKHVMKWYYPLRCRKLTQLSARKIIASIDRGIRGYRKQLSFEQYRARREENKKK